VAFQIKLGVVAVVAVVAVASRNDSWNFDCGVFKLPVTPLAAGCEGESRFPKVFEEIADFPWHCETLPILGIVATSIYKVQPSASFVRIILPRQSSFMG
jgi:hypothetical protein